MRDARRTSWRASSGGSQSRFSTPTGSPPGWLPARPTAICAMLTRWLPKIVPTMPMIPGTSWLTEDEQAAVHERFKPVFVEFGEPWHVLTEQRSGCSAAALVGDHFGRHGRAKDAHFSAPFFDQFDSSFVEQHLRIHQIDVRIEGILQQSGCKDRGKDTRLLFGNLTSKGEPAFPEAPLVESSHQESETIRDVEETAQRFNRLGIEGCNIDPMPDSPRSGSRR